ncbi:hypothetical protein DVS28_a2921 [Euzebya pacifica]|uniref:Uncharacterized protein n=1 Tax=Euzebya pacifica TaxID=1608957 RepID=A0A346XZF3_9ACTN|nr:hypothetical protein [Euzebya pacifica]AXV07600.1 hypothetical protein DVS28_a2921 [Euzebya pacifica]
MGSDDVAGGAACPGRLGPDGTPTHPSHPYAPYIPPVVESVGGNVLVAHVTPIAVRKAVDVLNQS